MLLSPENLGTLANFFSSPILFGFAFVFLIMLCVISDKKIEKYEGVLDNVQDPLTLFIFIFFFIPPGILKRSFTYAHDYILIHPDSYTILAFFLITNIIYCLINYYCIASLIFYHKNGISNTKIVLFLFPLISNFPYIVGICSNNNYVYDIFLYYVVICLPFYLYFRFSKCIKKLQIQLNSINKIKEK